MLTRRGFLQVLGAAMAGAAVFEPKSLLWVPKPKLRYGLVELVPEAKASVRIEQQLELNDLALQVAREMSTRLERSKAVVLSEVMFRHTGSLTPGTLHVIEQGKGYFEPHGRQMETIEWPGLSASRTQSVAQRLAQRLPCGAEMFAPIGLELRDGEPFSDCEVGVGTDPETGVSVRVMRFEMDRAGRRAEVRIGAEMAGGAFLSREHRASRVRAEELRNDWRRQYGED